MHEKFHYKSLEEIRQRAAELGEWLPLEEDVSILTSPMRLGDWTLPNRIALQPMEGTDGTEDGAPGPLTIRRYHRFAKGGAALIWFEAVATAPEVRASAHQLYLTPDNLDDFKRLVGEIKEIGLKENGFAPIVIMQATNSGRYSKPHGYPEPIIAYNNPIFEGDAPIPAERIVTDDQLRRYEEKYTLTARLAQQAGFDGIDIKCCHRYLACELLSAYTRPGEYGGSFENRTRFLRNCYRAAMAGVTGKYVFSSRLNAYDGFPYPYGFGVEEGGGLVPKIDEAVELVGLLQKEFGIPFIDITIGNPYKNPHVNRPYDVGNYVPDEHPFTGPFAHDALRFHHPEGASGSAGDRLGLLVSAAVFRQPGGGHARGRARRHGGLWPHGLRQPGFPQPTQGTWRDRRRQSVPHLRQLRPASARGHSGGLRDPRPGELQHGGVEEMKQGVIVTGASSGIGLATVRLLAEKGYGVVGMARSKKPEVLEKYAQWGAVYSQGDVICAEDRARALKTAQEAFGNVYALVNVAGVAPKVRADILEMTEESYDTVMNINTKGMMFMTQLVARAMLAQPRGEGLRGAIVNISSMSAYTSSISRGEYCISKAGASMITKLFADRLAGEGIIVNEVRPGIIRTEMTATVTGKYDALIAGGLLPIARWGEPEDIAKAVLLLIDGQLAYTTGQSIDVDGGFHIRRL